MANIDELACVYAALILAIDQAAITGDQMATVLRAADVSVEPRRPGLFAKSLEGSHVKELVSNVGSSAGSGPVAVSGAHAAAAAAAAPGAGDGDPAADQAKKEEKEQESGESGEDMSFGLFDGSSCTDEDMFFGLFVGSSYKDEDMGLGPFD